MHQQTKQNKTKTSRHRNNTTIKNFQAVLIKQNKKSSKKASRRTWFLQQLLGIKMFNLPFPFSSPTLNLCRCLLVETIWGKRLGEEVWEGFGTSPFSRGLALLAVFLLPPRSQLPAVEVGWISTPDRLPTCAYTNPVHKKQRGGRGEEKTI